MELTNARVLITGGSQGIGLETARLLSSKGALVAICGRNKAVLERAAEETGAIAIQADVSKEDQVVELIRRVCGEWEDYNCTDKQCRVWIF
jgi:3-oxoacyl-[acyl-carrier protein] reductase